jgi:hypothetical protein
MILLHRGAGGLQYTAGPGWNAALTIAIEKDSWIKGGDGRIGRVNYETLA